MALKLNGNVEECVLEDKKGLDLFFYIFKAGIKLMQHEA